MTRSSFTHKPHITSVDVIVPPAGQPPKGGTCPDALCLRNGRAAPLAALPVMSFARFSQWLSEQIGAGCRAVAFFAVPRESASAQRTAPPLFFLYAVLADDVAGLLLAARTEVGSSYPSLTPGIAALHLFERVLYEKFAILPEGHPWLKPVRFNNSAGPGVGEMDFYRIDGDEVHEVAVGPIHAGVIECGHFRFQCLGEEVLHLEISLGYHHRGVEAMLTGGPLARILPLMETVAGDSTAAHAFACCTLLEGLSETSPSPRGQHIRALALELERLACHTGDIGAIAGDVGFLPTSAFCGRLRGDWLNMSAMICGSRFSRGLFVPGGTAFDLDPALARVLMDKVALAARDVQGAVRLVWDSPSVMARLTGIGVLPTSVAASLGMVGPPARASGLARDARRSHPLPCLPALEKICAADGGDVGDRTVLRYDEVLASAALCQNILKDLPAGGCRAEKQKKFHAVAPKHIAVALAEGWRGEVCHVALTDEIGHFAAYSIVDPSFHNWAGLAYALRGQQISDFPLCNKSFNLSYCGHDL
ncbi:MAG: hydrogenase [Desulfovibrio sp.]|nr:hydrogenase [Desulfovibrio sp.]